MRPIEGWAQVQGNTGVYDRLAPGGYICEIISAKEERSGSGRDMLVIAFDIHEGNRKGYYKTEFDGRKSRFGGDTKWPGVYRQLTTDNAGGPSAYFKGLMDAIEGSNPGYKWNWDEFTLKGKRIGFVFREEEYIKNDGSIGTTVRPAWPRTVDEIRQGVEVPEIKRINNTSTHGSNGAVYGGNGAPPPDDDELPF